MTSLWLSMAVLVSVTAPIAVVMNLTMVYFILRRRALRELSVAGLVILCTFNDAVVDTQVALQMLETVRHVHNATTTYRMCTIEKIGSFYIIPVGKASLLALSIDRVFAVAAPMRYRKRDHVSFAINASAMVVTFCLGWCMYAASAANWTTAMMSRPCTAASVLPSDILTQVIAAALLVDLLVYVANGVLIYKISRGSHASVLPKQSMCSLADKSTARREAAITRSVRGAVLVHLVLGTIPFVLLGVAAAALDMGVISKETGAICSSMCTLCVIAESVFNTYIYVNRLPNFKAIVRRAIGKTSIK